MNRARRRRTPLRQRVLTSRVWPMPRVRGFLTRYGFEAFYSDAGWLALALILVILGLAITLSELLK